MTADYMWWNEVTYLVAKSKREKRRGPGSHNSFQRLISNDLKTTRPYLLKFLPPSYSARLRMKPLAYRPLKGHLDPNYSKCKMSRFVVD
jgi:hypothetical protein